MGDPGLGFQPRQTVLGVSLWAGGTGVDNSLAGLVSPTLQQQKAKARTFQKLLGYCFRTNLRADAPFR